MTTAADDAPLLVAARGGRASRVPVWFMRQAGRSLPEYRALREGTTMLDSCVRPDMAAEITLQPVRRHGVDEAILSCGFLSEEVRVVLGDIYNGMRLRYVVEEEPLGTAGPVRLALDQALPPDLDVVEVVEAGAGSLAERLEAEGYERYLTKA